MQALISLPEITNGNHHDRWAQRLTQKICGIPLLVRVIAGACRSGVTSVLIVHSGAVSGTWLQSLLRLPLLSSLSIQMVALEQPLDPANSGHWQQIESSLEATFLWVPWNYVTPKGKLDPILSDSRNPDLGLRFSGKESPLEAPAVVRKEALLETRGGDLEQYLQGSKVRSVPSPQPPGVCVNSPEKAGQAERLLIRGSGRPSDGIYSNFNRRLCWPGMRLLLKTPITASMVTWSGLPLILLSGYWYAQGYWGAYALAGLLYFLSVLVDEMDGMVARTKFQESAFGCWLETALDYLSYVVIWVGMTIGLYRQFGEIWLVVGGLTLFGTVTSCLLLIRLRKLATTADEPEKFHGLFTQRLEEDSAHLVSRIIRKIAFLAKKGVMCHYLLLFSVLPLVWLLLLLAAFGSNLTWMITLYTHRFFSSSTHTDSIFKDATGSMRAL